MRAVAAAVALGAADENVAEKLHLNLFETGAAAALALALAGIEAERAGVEPTLLCGLGLSEELTNVIKCANVHGRV